MSVAPWRRASSSRASRPLSSWRWPAGPRRPSCRPRASGRGARGSRPSDLGHPCGEVGETFLEEDRGSVAELLAGPSRAVASRGEGHADSEVGERDGKAQEPRRAVERPGGGAGDGGRDAEEARLDTRCLDEAAHEVLPADLEVIDEEERPAGPAGALQRGNDSRDHVLDVRRRLECSRRFRTWGSPRDRARRRRAGRSVVSPRPHTTAGRRLVVWSPPDSFAASAILSPSAFVSL